ncbi:MAG TPA: hypothetical protein VFX76_01930, partial [Roseiflexaceae bacterium]|nr:hypothetical protein [Roseiflexaceae bacterium]
VCLPSLPLELEFQLFAIRTALVLNTDARVGGNGKAFTGDLYRERLLLFQGIGQPAQFCDKVRDGVDLLDVTMGQISHNTYLFMIVEGDWTQPGV